MDSLFTVVDTAGKARYEGSSLREGYDIWKIVVHATYIHTDKDCGGGTTLDFADESGYARLMDSSCGRMSCDDCNPDDVDTPTEPQPLDEADEWVVFGHDRDTRLGYFADWRDAHVEYDAQHDKCRATTGHEQGLCHIRIAHKSDPKFLVQTGE